MLFFFVAHSFGIIIASVLFSVGYSFLYFPFLLGFVFVFVMTSCAFHAFHTCKSINFTAYCCNR